MGVLRDSIGADEHAQSASPPGTGPVAGPAVAKPPAGGGAAEGHSELQRRREELAEQVTELHWDLGGLVYEMAIRDHFRLDVLVRRAAVLQERDAELAEIERLLAMEESGAVGACPQCGAPHSRGAVFCWQCGTALLERSSGATVEGATTVMDALLAPAGPDANHEGARASGESASERIRDASDGDR